MRVGRSQLVPLQTIQGRQLKIVLIYQACDQESGGTLKNLFQKSGFQVWTEGDVLPGQTDYHRQTRLREADFIIILQSRISLQQRGVYQQYINWTVNLLDEMPDEGILVFPILLDEVVRPHSRLGHFWQVRSWVSGDWEKMAEAIRQECERR